jgi:uncharacterized protein DUF397
MGDSVTTWTCGQFRKSSYSNGGNDNCVQIALRTDIAAIADSKNPTLTVAQVARPTLDAFLAAVKTGQFDLIR